MAGLKEIKRRIHSVKNTKKITYAMKLVSAAKLRRAQESALQSRAFHERLLKLCGEVTAQISGKDFIHPLMENRDVKTIGIIIVGGSRGLCGGYNTNVNKKIESVLKDIATTRPGVQVKLFVLGRKPSEYLRRTNKKYEASHENLPEDANVWPIDTICTDIEDLFLKRDLDEVYVMFTHFKSALSMTVRFDKLLPLSPDIAQNETAGASAVTLIEPDIETVVKKLFSWVVRSTVRQACLNAKAGEQASRMTAMDAATKNAGDLIHKLTLQYNKVRQTGITSELLDIIGGAEAIQ